MCARVWLSASVCLLWLTGKALGDCVLPEHPIHGRHQAHGGGCERVDRHPACDGTPGTLAPDEWFIVVRCDPGYQHLDPSSADVPSVCLNGVWSKPELPKCGVPNLLTRTNEMCVVPTPSSNAQYRILSEECSKKNVSPGSLVPPDCILHYYCAPGFKVQDGMEERFHHCNNKSWIPPIPTDLCKSPLSTTDQMCVVSTTPPNALYRVLAKECGDKNISPGLPVPVGCILHYYCAPGFQVQVGKKECFTHCNKNGWKPPVPTDLCTRADGPVPQPTFPQNPNYNYPSTSVVTVQSSTGCNLPETSTIRKFCSLANDCAENCDFYNDRCLVPSGSRVKNVRVVCAPGYTTKNPTSTNIAICLQSPNKWFPPIPECKKLCRPLATEMLLLTCRFGTNIVDCSDWALPDTTVSLECAPTFSEYPDLKRQGVYRRILTCTSRGEWSHNLPPCKPACGVFNKNLKEFSPTIVNGEKAKLGFFPWHAGLYYRSVENGNTVWNQQCGGSLISDRFILTAAHCVSTVDDISSLRVALGKYYRSWDQNERSQEKRNVSAIRISPQYVSSTLIFDIALVYLSERIKFGAYIMPVCRDFDSTTNHYQTSKLYVVGWGKTDPSSGSKSSDILLFNSVKAISDNQCRRAVPSFFTTFEKICAVKSNTVSITQKGDSGGGLTAVYRDGLHYIVGIVSTKVDSVSIFTNIKWKQHIEWMENEMRGLEDNQII